MKELLVLVGIVFSLSSVQTENLCTGGRAGGLLALSLCKYSALVFLAIYEAKWGLFKLE